MKRLLIRSAILGVITSLAHAAEPRLPVRAVRALSPTGLSMRVDAESPGVTLRRPQDVIAHVQGMPGIYTGATDPLIAIDFGNAPMQLNSSSWVYQRFSARISAGDIQVIVSRLSPAVLVDSPEKTLRLLPPQAAATAVRTRNRATSRDVQSEGMLPRYLAWIEADRPVIRGVTELNEGAPLRMDEPWMLAWFGSSAVMRGHADIFDLDSAAGVDKPAMDGRSEERVDVPLLIRFERRPSALSQRDGRIVVEFAKAAGKVAIMPLFGRRVWLPQETEDWRDALPEQVVRQCRHWSRWLRDCPVDVKETFELDPAGDVLTIRQAFDWIALQDDWQTPPVHAAPIPPMLAVALGGRMPVTFMAQGKEVTPLDGGLMDFAGKMMAIEGAESYEYRIAGLGNHLWAARGASERRSVGAIASFQTDAATLRPPNALTLPRSHAPTILQRRLEQYVADVTAAGHLRPLFMFHGGVGNWNASWYWVGTPEMAYALARAYPYLSSELQVQVQRYVRNEWEQHPPLELSARHYTEGAAREPYALEPAGDRAGVVQTRDEAYRRRNFFFDLYRIEAATAIFRDLPEIPRIRERAAAMAAELVNQQDWAISGPVRLRELGSAHEARFGTLQGSAAYNGWLAGAIGLARLARKHGWQEEERLACYLFGKLAVARVGQARFVEEMHRMGLVRGKLEDDYRAISHVDERCTIVRWGPVGTITAEDQEFPPFIDLAPETGQLLAKHAAPQCAVYLNYLDRGVPYWYLSEAPKQSATEHHLSPLWHLSGNVPAQAWILGKAGPSFCRYVDVTRFRGDWFAIQNLVTAIDSCGSSKAR